uniref:No apical meristem-associated C-terminal domain-containing protein n=1 Tax=Arundo donax TaxID=35708 RepID=A0A0A9DVW5_ARUDO
MHGYMNLLSGNWDESQFVTPCVEQSFESQTIVEETLPLKRKKKGARNFSEKEDILLVKAWLEISQDAVHGNEQSRTSYWQRIHDHYHSYKDFISDRNVNSLSHRWGVIQESVNRFCGWYAQIQNMRQSGVSAQDKVQQACIVYKKKDPKGKSFPFLHCWNVLQHAQKWSDIGSQKKQKTCSNSIPRSSTPGTNESHHVEEDDGVTHTSPLKTRERPEGKKKAKERGKNHACQVENLYNDTLDKFWSKKEKVEEFKEMRKKERNDERLAIEKQRLELEKQQFEFKRNMEDERVMNMDLSGMSERQQMFYRSMQDEIIARRFGTSGS